MRNEDSRGNGQWAMGNGESQQPSPAAEQNYNSSGQRTPEQHAYWVRKARRWNSGSVEIRQLMFDIGSGHRWFREVDEADRRGGNKARRSAIKTIMDREGFRHIEVRACIALFEADMQGRIGPEVGREDAEILAGIRNTSGELVACFRGLLTRDRWSDTDQGRSLIKRAEAMAAVKAREPRLIKMGGGERGCAP